MRVSRYHYYCFIYHRSEEVTVSDVIWAGGGNKRQLRPQSTAGLLSIHQTPEPNSRTQGRLPLPHPLPLVLGPGQIRDHLPGSWELDVPPSVQSRKSSEVRNHPLRLCMPQSPGISGSCGCFKATRN